MDHVFVEVWGEEDWPQQRVLTAPVRVNPIFSPGNLWPGQSYGIMVEVERLIQIPNLSPLRFALYFYFPPALGQAETLLNVGDELLCFYGRFPFPTDPRIQPDPFGRRDRRRYAGLTISRINGATPPRLQQSRPPFVVEQATDEYEQWLAARRPKRKARPPEERPQFVIEGPSKEYEEYLERRRKGPPPIAAPP
jgi:hypothetical protein